MLSIPELFLPFSFHINEMNNNARMVALMVKELSPEKKIVRKFLLEKGANKSLIDYKEIGGK